MKIDDFQSMKNKNKKISIITCYDYWSAKIIADSNVDCILVGDSLAMVMHGHATTIPATIDLMAIHIEAVVRGNKNKFIIADLPFCSYRKGLANTMEAVQKVIQAGAHAIKLEGAIGNEETITHIINSGVPVMGHIGLTPQFIHCLGGFKTQGKDKKSAEKIIQAALALEQTGCFAMLLEYIPSNLAQEITAQLTIPTIGIGAGHHCSGQVLVLQDILGLNKDLQLSCAKKYLDGYNLIKTALNQFDAEIKAGEFPHE